MQIGTGSATILNFDLKPISASYNKIVEDIFTLMSTNNYALLIIGLVLMITSLVLISVACHHKRKASKRRVNEANGMFNLSKNINSVGFHRYNEIVDNSDEESLTRIESKKSTNANRYPKSNEGDSRKLLFTDDDEDDQDDKIFIR